MRSQYRNPDVRYEVFNGHLVRTVTAPDGRSYTHRCPRDAYAAVADTMQSVGEAGATTKTLVAALGLPYTQVSVALEFLRERGCIKTHCRRGYPASTFVFEDAMIEYFALGQEQ